MSAPDLWTSLRRTTRARIGLGRAGNAVPTSAELAFRAAHAGARDAVHDALDVDDLRAQVQAADLGDPAVVTSRAVSRAEYLRRPDLGRQLGEDASLRVDDADLAVVLADGLSARAVSAHAVSLLVELRRSLGDRLGVPVIATNARVALGDPIGEALGARAVLVLVGERPGLSVHDSLGAYLTYAPRIGRHDAERNCVSNVHPPDGLGYEAAARAIAGLVEASFVLGESGVRVKDRSRAALTGEAADALA